MWKLVIIGVCAALVSASLCPGLQGQEASAGPYSWTGCDVGKVGTAGQYVEKDGVFTVRGAGGGVFIARDAFHFVYVPLKGDGEITIRAVSVKNSVANTSLGPAP